MHQTPIIKRQAPGLAEKAAKLEKKTNKIVAFQNQNQQQREQEKEVEATVSASVACPTDNQVELVAGGTAPTSAKTDAAGRVSGQQQKPKQKKSKGSSGSSKKGSGFGDEIPAGSSAVVAGDPPPKPRRDASAGMPSTADVLILEPFFDGSHKQMIDTILAGVDASKYLLLTMSGKKWHWRARISGLHFQQRLQRATAGSYDFKVLFASSVLNLTEFVALRPEFNSVKKILYFHENELSYPVVEPKERDFYYGYSQILSCLVADVLLFNSSYNMTSFLGTIAKFMKIIPDYGPDVPEMIGKITPKCQVIYFPVIPPPLTPVVKDADGSGEASGDDSKVLKILWPHRWEHDKDPEAFFDCLCELRQNSCQFQLAILGQRFSEVPPVFDAVKDEFRDEIVQLGFLESKEEYWKVLQSCDVVVSTAAHEFFGVGMVEAAMAGCYPLCPDRLSYPELFPKECLYRTPAQMKRTLAGFCKHPRVPRKKALELKIAESLEKFKSSNLVPKFHEHLGLLMSA